MTDQSNRSFIQYPDWFKGRTSVIATNHGKEQVISPMLARNLGIRSILAESLNTDQFGTFSGEIERTSDALTAAQKKCNTAMDLTGCDLALSTEGSFGSHPFLAFVPAHEELIVLIDRKHNVEFKTKLLTTSTNYAANHVSSEDELLEFAQKALFPSHGLILTFNEFDHSGMVKGITQEEELFTTFRLLKKTTNSVWVQTDMRAHYNPSRMSVIEELTQQLIDRLLTLCPSCQTPGFGTTEAVQGLPCEWCHQPTESTLYFLQTCVRCHFTESIYFPHGKQKESAMYCQQCNP